MGKVFRQRFESIYVEPAQNYININDHHNFNVRRERIIRFHRKNKKNTKYFYGDKNQDYLSVPIKREPGFYITKQRQIKRHIYNPFSFVKIISYERSIRINDDNITFVLYILSKKRDLNHKYFKKHAEYYSITINKKNYNITTVEKTNASKPIIRKNSFIFLYQILDKSKIFTLADIMINKRFDKKTFNNFKEVMNDDEFLDKTMQYLSSIPLVSNNTINILPKLKINNTINVEIFNSLINIFVVNNKIKIPNDFFKLLYCQYPTKRILKKNGGKLIAAILDKYKIKSDYTIKILHKFPNINFYNFRKLCYLFDDDHEKYLGNLDPNVIFFCCDNTEPMFHDLNRVKFNITNEEKSNVIKILRDLYKNSTPGFLFLQSESLLDKCGNAWSGFRHTNIIGDLYDHFNMLDQVKRFDPSIKLRSTTFNNFTEEHHYVTSLIAKIQAGTTRKYVFNNKLIDLIEEPIYDQNNNILFEPIILKTGDDYNEESQKMHHCVSTYINYENSLIISIRINKDNERVTIEYHNKTGQRIQAQYFSNSMPPEKFNNAITILDNRIKTGLRQKILKWESTELVPHKINGIDVTVMENHQNIFHELAF